MNADDYRALVGPGTLDFKKVFPPDSEMLATEAGVVTMAGKCGDSDHLLWKVWIPPGTRSLQATLYVYYGKPAGKVVIRWGKPPVGGLDSVTAENAAAVDLTNVLALLLTGAEVPCYTPEYGGAIKLSAGLMDSPVMTHTGDWLYIKVLQAPGAPGPKMYMLDARVIADEALYRQWYDTALWDEQGNPIPGAQAVDPGTETPPTAEELAVLQLALDSGLAASFSLLSGGLIDDPLINAVKKAGTWGSLLKFYRKCVSPK